MAKFFTEQATGGSRGGASDEEMEQGLIQLDEPHTDVWEREMLPMPEEQEGGFLGRPKGWER